MRREIKYVNGAKRMADFLGPSKDLITLSQVLTYYNSLYIIKLRGSPRQDTFSCINAREAAMFFYHQNNKETMTIILILLQLLIVLGITVNRERYLTQEPLDLRNMLTNNSSR